MALDELATVLRARRFVSEARPTTIPVPMQVYLNQAGASLHRETDLQADEPGWSFTTENGKRYICVNAADREERQRFTICHEIGHFVLGLPSDHETQPWSAKRPLAEKQCDAFAAELLLPERLFRPLVERSSVGLASVDALADRFLASTTAAGFRFAAVVSTPCAFVLSEKGRVRYASRSKALIDAGAWIAPGMRLPRDTASNRARVAGTEDSGQIDADVWFSSWERGGTLLEEVRHLPKWDQTLSLLWFESEEVPAPGRDRHRSRWEEGWEGDEHRVDEDEPALEELGAPRWPSRSRRR